MNDRTGDICEYGHCVIGFYNLLISKQLKTTNNKDKLLFQAKLGLKCYFDIRILKFFRNLTSQNTEGILSQESIEKVTKTEKMLPQSEKVNVSFKKVGEIAKK